MKNTQRGFVPILIIIAVLAIGGGVFYWQKTKSSRAAQGQTDENTSEVIRVSETSTTQIPRNIVYDKSPMTPEQIEQAKIRENLAANQNKQPVDMVSKPCTNNIKAEQSTSAEYSALVQKGWTFGRAVISDFDCDGSKDVIVSSSYILTDKGKEVYFKGMLQYFQKVNNSWKLINSNDFLSGEPFDMAPSKTSEGANAVILTFKPSGKKGIVWIRNGYPTGI